jgi:hypothetical protein
MLGTTWYHASVRKVVAAFGSLFNNISIERVDDDTSTTTKTLKVPIAWVSQRAFIKALNEPIAIEETLISTKIQTILPRMGFSITDIAYDSTRKTTTITKHLNTGTSNSVIKSAYRRVPYTITLELNIAYKHIEDGLRIIEQILPYFTPEYSVTINDITDLGIDTDIPFVLQSVQSTDEIESNFEDHENIRLWVLSFEAKTYFYGPVTEPKIITTSMIDMYINNWTPNYIGGATREERITAVPETIVFDAGVGTFTADEFIYITTDKDGNTVSDNLERARAKATVVSQSGTTVTIKNLIGGPPIADEVWKGDTSEATGTVSSYDEGITIEHFSDAKRYDPETGTDV